MRKVSFHINKIIRIQVKMRDGQDIPLVMAYDK